MEGNSFFKYRPGNTFMHRLPPWLKIIMMLALAMGAFYCPSLPALIIWLALILFSAIFLHFSLNEIISDLSVTFIYATMLYVASVISNISEAGLISPSVLIPKIGNFSPLTPMALSLEISSVFYRTTSTMSFRKGFSQIEGTLRKDGTPLSDALSLTLSFIPGLATFWHKTDNAWKARMGKNGLKKIMTLTPILFRTGMGEAYKKSLALQNRGK
ncbi:MAG: hypothetical protein ILP07_04505 [Treponema sp.]|nr:hypothetical protein [Treponema sp.]